jgi:hypothetical protein
MLDRSDPGRHLPKSTKELGFKCSRSGQAILDTADVPDVTGDIIVGLREQNNLFTKRMDHTKGSCECSPR